MSVDFSWNTAMSVPLLKLSREDRASGWPASFSLKRIALLQYPDLDPAEPGNWRVRKSQDVLEQALRQAVLSGGLDAVEKANLVEQDSVARGDDGVQRIVQGTRTVETHEIAALALLNWFNEQDIAPSEHMRAWFDATGASFAVLWKEKNEKYAHPGEEADRFTERSFLEGYEDVTDKVRGQQRTQGQSPVRREEASPERCAELAGLERFKAADWIALTGIGLGKFGHYRISTEGVRFLEWKEEEREAEGNSTDDQEQMLRDNDVPALSFPCTADELIAFVDSETADGTRFDLPMAFRLALSEMQAATGLRESHSSLALKKSCVQEKEKIEADKEPLLKEGQNRREHIRTWVEWCARNIKEDDDTAEELAGRVVQRAERFSIESERGPLSVSSVTRLLPAGATGGRGRRPGSRAKIKSARRNKH